MRFVACDLCGSSKNVPLFRQREFQVSNGDGSFPLVQCQKCGLIYLNPRPEGLGMVTYYPQNYYDDLEPIVARTAPRESCLWRLRKSLGRSLLERFYQYPPECTDPPAPVGALVNVIKAIYLRGEKVIAAVARPLVYALGAMNRGTILPAHATKEKAEEPVSPERGWALRSGGSSR